MSYILDALKKSESERRAAAAPGLAAGASFILAPQSRPRHRGTAVILGIGMLATGLALGNWRSWQGGPVAAPPAPVQLATQLPELPVALPGVQKAPVAAEKKTASADQKVVTTERKVAPTEKKALAAAPKKKPVGEANAAPPQAATAAATPHAPSSVAVALPAAPARAAASPHPARPAPAVAVAPVAAAAPAAPAAAAPADRVLAYRELPPAVQGALPRIVFGGFAGGNEGEAKMAFINSRLVREGEDLSPGLRLEAVNQDGAVFAYQGYRFRAAN